MNAAGFITNHPMEAPPGRDIVNCQPRPIISPTSQASPLPIQAGVLVFTLTDHRRYAMMEASADGISITTHRTTSGVKARMMVY